MVLQVKSCCCGCSVRTGTLIIAWLSIVGSILLIILGIAGAVMFDKAIDEADNQEKVTIGTYGSVDKEAAKKVFTLFLALAIVFVIAGFVELIVTGLLLHGVYKERPSLFKPWMVCAIIGLVLHTIGVLGNVIVHFAGGQIIAALLEIVMGGVGIFVGLYYLCVINSHRMELLAQNASPKI